MREQERLKSEVTDYQATTSTLQGNLKQEQEGRQQTASSLESQLGAVKDELDTVQANATSLQQQNQVDISCGVAISHEEWLATGNG